jgi:predicted DNA-binding transcriptional regulator YafY
LNNKGERMNNEMAILNVMMEAISEGKKVRVTYQNADGVLTKRIIVPKGVYESMQHNKLVSCDCELRDEIRTFRLDRFKDAEII